MSHSKPLTPIITPILHDHSRTNLVPWKIAINRAARGVFAEWDPIRRMQRRRSGRSSTPPRGKPMLVLKPVTFSNAPRRDSRAAWLACSAAFAVAILDSIGESNRLAIADPVTDTLNLTPRDIITAMTRLHGTVTGAEVDLLRLPLKKKLYPLPTFLPTSSCLGDTLHGSPQPDKLL
jgi:hypothetical protein